MFASGELTPVAAHPLYCHSRAWVYPEYRVPEAMSIRETPVVHSHPEIMSGTPVFVGTGVPFQTLVDYLEAGQPLSKFLEDFSTVSRELVVGALEQAKEALLAPARPV
jgi:uncharacterized protein (DUF433 family)